MRACALVPFLVLILHATPLLHAHNITRILAQHPNFSTFNRYLTQTQLDVDINARNTITVLAVDDAAMSDLLAKHLSIFTMKNILSIHVLLDYFDEKKLENLPNKTEIVTTLFQSTGLASGSSGFVNISDVGGRNVSVGISGYRSDAFFVKSLSEIPYNISVVQISRPLESVNADAPAPAAASFNLTQLLSGRDCKLFAGTLVANVEAYKAYQDALLGGGGLTVFSPMDNVFKLFLTKYNNLSSATRASLLRFLAVPSYQSLPMLKSYQRQLMSTLATNGTGGYNFTVQNKNQDVLLKTESTTARIIQTLEDVQPLAIYSIDNVLLPAELSIKPVAPASAPVPAPPRQAKAASQPPSQSPADAPSGNVADGGNVSNAGVGFHSEIMHFIVLMIFSFAIALF